LIEQAIEGALQAKKEWENLPWEERCAVFLKAADLLSNKYRYQVLAATILGQGSFRLILGKNAWQAEIEAAAELIDFWRFNCLFAEEIYTKHYIPKGHSPTIWNRVEFRALEGFIIAISPFNFTAIGGNLPSAPALMGNVVLWKPAQYAVLSNYFVYKILQEAGLPKGVIQFLPSDPEFFVDNTIKHKMFSGLHFTGSTFVFRELWKKIGNRIDTFLSYPRIVGETGGKNFHLVHPSADIDNVINQTLRAAYEFQGQKCSACSRMFIPVSFSEQIIAGLKKGAEAIKLGELGDIESFGGPVIHGSSFKKISRYVKIAKDEGCRLICGGEGDDSKGWYFKPTIFVTESLDATTLKEEIFGPVLTIYIYPDEKYLEMVNRLADPNTCMFALTGAIFASDRSVIKETLDLLRHAAGNLYVNDKCTAAIVGQQPFGGSRGSGTNDKAGSGLNLIRWTSPLTIKESMVGISSYLYPSNVN
jgi:1-pyrroline-5-carboxylate dehydrogenase